jgi:rubrerythrin
MAASDSPPVGLNHPSVNPHPSVTPSTHGTCECNDCGYAIALDDDLPPKCPDCGGALQFTVS